MVFQGKDLVNNDAVAVKRVYIDRRYKNRELEILQEVTDHPYILAMDAHYFTNAEKNGDSYLHIVTELFPESLAMLIKKSYKLSRSSQMQMYEPIPLTAVRLYAW